MIDFPFPWKLLWGGKRDEILGRENTFLSLESKVPFGQTRDILVYANRDEKITKSSISNRIEGKVIYPFSISVLTFLPELIVQSFTGPGRMEGNYGLQLLVKHKQRKGGLKIESSLNLIGQSLTKGGNINSTLRYDSKKIGVTGVLTLEDVKYPLTHVIDRRTVRETKGELKIEPIMAVHLKLDGKMGTNRYDWDKIRNKDYYSGGSKINLTVGPMLASYHEQFSKEYLKSYANELSERRYRELSIQILEEAETAELLFTTHVSIEFFNPPMQLTFNTRNKRLIRSTLKLSRDFWGFNTTVGLLFRTEDEVFMDPSRSSYTRRDEFYRIDGTVKGKTWSNRTSIVSAYSKFRFIPARNILIRYFEDEINIDFKDFRLSALYHMQDNGQYLPHNQNQYLFHLEKKVNEFKLEIRVPALRFNLSRVYFEVSRYLRWERRGPGSFNLIQSEKGIGVTFTQSKRANLLIKWIDRMREKPGLYISTRLELTI